MIDSRKFGHAGLRPVLCEGGPAYIQRMSLLNPFMNYSGNKVVEAYEPHYLESAAEANANLFLLTFSEGMLPAGERDARAQFCEASQWLREQGMVSLAGIAAGHAAVKHRGRRSGIFSRTPKGRMTPSWLPGYFMTCWTSPEWMEEIDRKVSDSLECGAEGVWFDMVMFGAAPVSVNGRLFGPAGCSCPRCMNAFYEWSGVPVSRKNFSPKPAADDPLFAKYAEWRSHIVAAALKGWRETADRCSKGAIVAVVLNMLAQLDGATLFGADVERIAGAVDIVIAETNSVIRFDKEGLTYNGATSEVLRLYAPGCDIADMARHHSPGYDAVPPVELFKGAMIEPVVHGVATMLRTPVFLDEKTLEPVVFTDESLRPHREFSAAFWNWIDRSPELFAEGRHHAQTALLHDRPSMSIFSPDASARFFKMFQTLTELHIPLRVVTAKDLGTVYLEGVRVIVVPKWESISDDVKASLISFHHDGGRMIFIGTAPEWAGGASATVLDGCIFEEKVNADAPKGLKAKLLEKRHSGTPAVYLQHRFPAAGVLARAMVNAGLYRVPDEWKKIYDTVSGLIEKSGRDVVIEAPPYIHVREVRSSGNAYFHAANLLPGFPGQNACVLRFPAPVSARIMTPDKNKIIYLQDRSIGFEVETYAVVEIKGRS